MILFSSEAELSHRCRNTASLIGVLILTSWQGRILHATTILTQAGNGRQDPRIESQASCTSADFQSANRSGLLVYEPKSGHDADDERLPVDPLEFLARVLIHIPETNKHLVHFYGAYANRVRSTLRHSQPHAESSQSLPPRRALSKRWAELIYRIYDVDPLTCSHCGGEMKILAFITEPAAIQKILRHRDHKRPRPRAPPSHAKTAVH